MKSVMIIGLGLIGSSIALGIKRAHPEIKRVGYDQPKVSKIALERGIIDREALSLDEAKQADVIILAVPIAVTLDFLHVLAQLDLKEGVLITDTGSTKGEIMALAGQLFDQQRVKFVGGHPMAGSHKSGVLAADVHLFENAYYVLSEKNEPLMGLLKGLKAKFIVIHPEVHDKITAQVSHFPHILASALVLQSEEYAREYPLVKSLAAGGFRDLTRIAEADSQLWTSVVLSNPKILMERIENFKEQLDRVLVDLSQGAVDKIQDFFESGKKIREGMEIHQGAMPNFYDLFVAVPDEKGVVARVLLLLQELSITNIKINEKNREEIEGQLQISFKSEGDLERARDIIRQNTVFKVV